MHSSCAVYCYIRPVMDNLPVPSLQIDEARTSVTTQLEKKKRQRRLGRCDECGRKTGITSAFPCRFVHQYI